MSFARDLVELEEALREHVEIDLFAPTDQNGLLTTPETAGLLSRVATLSPGDPVAVMRLCLQALRIQHDEMSPRLLEAELVATLPPDIPGLARPTGQVLREMLVPNAKEIILLGYELSDPGMLGLLADAAMSGADVIMICDRGRGSAKRVLEGWPSGLRLPRLFHDRQRADGAPHASMHAKCLLVDGRNLLITSANFTFHGLHGNIEIGVRLCGAPAAEARKIFSHLVENGIVEELQ